MNVSNSTSINTVASTPQAVASTSKQEPVAASDTQQNQDSAVVKISERAQQASHAESQKNTERNDANAQESRAASSAAAARSAETSKTQAAQADAKRVNTFA